MSEYAGKNEQELRAMLEDCTNFDDRRKIRAAIRDLTGGPSTTITRSYSLPRSSSAGRSKTYTSSLVLKQVANNSKQDSSDKSDTASSAFSSNLKPSLSNGRSLVNNNKYVSALAARSSGLQRSSSLRTPRESSPRLLSNGLFKDIKDRYSNKMSTENTVDVENGDNPWEKFTDEKDLNVQLHDSRDFEERRKIRAAIRKLREKKQGVDNLVQPSMPVTPDVKITRSEDRNNNENPADDNKYSHILDEKQLRNMLYAEEDYFEKKKIRAAIRDLKLRAAKMEEDNARTSPAKSQGLSAETSSEPKISSETAQASTVTSQRNDESHINNHKNNNHSAMHNESSTTHQSHDRSPANSSLESASLNNSSQNSDESHRNKKSEETVANISSEVGSKDELGKMLEESKDFDKRREIRSSIRELRSQIRAGGMRISPLKCESAETTSNVASCHQDDSSKPVTLPENQVSSTSLVLSPTTAKSLDLDSGQNGEVSVEKTETNSDGKQHVSFKVRKTRTPSLSEVEQKESIIERLKSTPGGTEYLERDTIKTRKKMTPRGSLYYEQESLLTRRVALKSGSEYEETDIIIEKDCESVSTGQISSDISEGKVVIERPGSSLTSASSEKDGEKKALLDGKVKVIEEKGLTVPSDTGVNISKSSSGYNSCSGSEEEESDDSTQQQTNTEGKTAVLPEITTALTDVTAVDGKKAVFQCGVLCSEASSVSWYKNSKLLESSKDFEQTFHGSVARLTIDEVYPDDEGEYRCTVRSGDAYAETAAILTVKAEVIEEIAPKFTETLKDETVFEGDEVCLQCYVCGIPDPLIKWYHNNVILRNTLRSKQTYDCSWAKLHIKSVDKSSAGTYDCVARNTAGVDKNSCSLHVQQLESPQITNVFTDETITVGESVQFECEVTGTPRPKVTWLADNQEVTDRSRFIQEYSNTRAKLTIQNAELADSADYTCKAQNEAGMTSVTAPLTVKDKKPVITEYAPTFTQPLADVSATDGEPACLQCHLLANPEATVTWYKNNKILRESVLVKQKFDGKVAKIEFREIFNDDSGEYACVAKNSIGESKTKSKITVKEGSFRGRGTKEDTKKSVFMSPVTSKKMEKLSPGGADVTRLVEGVQTKSIQITKPSPARSSWTDMLIGKKTDTKTGAKSILKETHTDKMANIDNIEDEELLHRMLNETDNFGERKKIRNKLREISEKASLEFERKKAAKAVETEDAVQMKIRQANKEKERKMKEFEVQAKTNVDKTGDPVRMRMIENEKKRQEKLEQYKQMAPAMSAAYGSNRGEFTKREAVVAASSKERKMDDFKKEAVYRSTKDEPDGSTAVTQQTRNVTQAGGLGGTFYGVKGQTTGKPTGARGARAAFQQMDKANAPAKPNYLSGGAGSRVTVQRSASTIKQMLLEWAKAMTRGYANVDVQNFSSSWNNGMAFCALIHHFFPDAFDYNQLDPTNRRYNFELSFKTAEQRADISPLLDVEDMVRMKNPDWKCVFTYVQSLYRHLRNHENNQQGQAAP